MNEGNRVDLLEQTKVTGTLVWYYYICSREVWLMARHVIPNPDDENILVGRFLQEFSYKREKKEVNLENVKFDIIKKKRGKVVVGEVKKSSRYLKSARMQLAFYLLQLKEQGLEAEGELLVPEERKKEKVILDEDTEKELFYAKEEIKKIISEERPPSPQKTPFCKKCAYSDFCWI